VVTDPQTPTHRQDRLQYTAPQLASKQHIDDDGDYTRSNG